MNVILIDDEIGSIEILQQKIIEFTSNVNIISTFNDPQVAKEFLQKNSVDAIFLDVEMPKMNGFEFLSSFEEQKFEVIFTTAYSEFAIDALRVSAFDYLTKPIMIEDLQKCILRLERYLNKTKKDSPIKFKKIAQQNEKLLITTVESIEYVSIENIIYIKAESNYSKLHTANGKNILVSKHLGDFEENLFEYGFFRPHHSYLTNIKHIEKYVKDDGGYLMMSDGSKVDVSKRKKEEMFDILKSNSI